MTSFYATLRTRSRGALPLLSADSSPTLRGARGQAPCTPKIAPFRLPSSVTLFLGRSGPRKSVPQTNFFPQSLHAQRCVFTRVLPLFLMSIDPHAGQQSGVVLVVLAWCWRGAGLVTDEAQMVNLPCRELQKGVALGKGRSAPNASPSRDCPRQCTRDQSLDPLSPRPKGSEGWAVPTPCRVQRVGSFSVKGQDERSATALDCVPPWSLPVTWLDVKGQYADRLRSGNPLHPLCPGHSPCRGAVKDCFPLPMAMWGSGQSPENGSRDKSLVGVKGQTAPAPGGHEKLSLQYFDKKKRASLKRKCYKPSKIKGFRVFRQLTIFNVLVNFCLLECKIIFNYAVNLCLTLQ